jgi:hypothetical protein
VASRATGQPEYPTIWEAGEKWKSGPQFPSAGALDRIKTLGSHTTKERTNRRQEPEFRMALKWAVLLVYEKYREKNVKICLGREPTRLK